MNGRKRVRKRDGTAVSSSGSRPRWRRSALGNPLRLYGASIDALETAPSLVTLKTDVSNLEWSNVGRFFSPLSFPSCDQCRDALRLSLLRNVLKSLGKACLQVYRAVRSLLLKHVHGSRSKATQTRRRRRRRSKAVLLLKAAHGRVPVEASLLEQVL